jgi:hypothetical protein
MIPDTFHRRSQLIPSEQVRVPYLHQNSILGLHCSPLHANPTPGVRRSRRRRGRLRGNETLRVAGELRWGGAGDGFGAACTRSGAQGRVPVPGGRRRLGKAKRPAGVRGEGSLSCVRPLLAGWSDGRGVGRRRASSSEQRRERTSGGM